MYCTHRVSQTVVALSCITTTTTDAGEGHEVVKFRTETSRGDVQLYCGCRLRSEYRREVFAALVLHEGITQHLHTIVICNIVYNTINFNNMFREVKYNKFRLEVKTLEDKSKMVLTAARLKMPPTGANFAVS